MAVWLSSTCWCCRVCRVLRHVRPHAEQLAAIESPLTRGKLVLRVKLVPPRIDTKPRPSLLQLAKAQADKAAEAASKRKKGEAAKVCGIYCWDGIPKAVQRQASGFEVCPSQWCPVPAAPASGIRAVAYR